MNQLNGWRHHVSERISFTTRYRWHGNHITIGPCCSGDGMPVTMRNRRSMHIKLFRKLFYSAYEIQVGGWRNCVATNFSFFYTEADRIRCLAIVIKYPQASGMKLETSLFCFYVYLLIISGRNWIHINWHSLTQHTANRQIRRCHRERVNLVLVRVPWLLRP